MFFYLMAAAEFPATIAEVSKKNVTVNVTERIERSSESPLDLHLGQVISRGDKMEFTIQKSVELGVNTITPLFQSAVELSLILNASRKSSRSGKRLLSRHVNNLAVIRFQLFAQSCNLKSGAANRAKR